MASTIVVLPASAGFGVLIRRPEALPGTAPGARWGAVVGSAAMQGETKRRSSLPLGVKLLAGAALVSLVLHLLVTPFFLLLEPTPRGSSLTTNPLWLLMAANDGVALAVSIVELVAFVLIARGGRQARASAMAWIAFGALLFGWLQVIGIQVWQHATPMGAATSPTVRHVLVLVATGVWIVGGACKIGMLGRLAKWLATPLGGLLTAVGITLLGARALLSLTRTLTRWSSPLLTSETAYWVIRIAQDVLLAGWYLWIALAAWRVIQAAQHAGTAPATPMAAPPPGMPPGWS